MAESIAALGFKLHTGWAACVAVMGWPDGLRVLARRRAALLPEDGSIPRFVYHTAAELDSAKAEDLVRRAERAAFKLAEAAVAELIDQLRAQNAIPSGCGVIVGSTQVKSGMALSAILRAHTLIHAAEGVLFQEAVIAACQRRELPVTPVREREVWTAAAKVSRCRVDLLRGHVDALRKSVGAPWSADEKSATAAAIAASLHAYGANADPPIDVATV